MRCRWLYLIFLILLLEFLVSSAGQRTRQRRSGNQLKSRIATGANTSPGRVRGKTGTKRLQPRIVGGNSGRNTKGNSNRRRQLNRNKNRRSSSSSKEVSSRIVDNSSLARITQGSTTSITRLPYIVQLMRGSNNFCGGSLISSRWVLSAAHCVSGHKPSVFRVVGGTSTFNGTDGVVCNVTFIAIPSRYTSSLMNMDAALLKLGSEMTGTYITPIQLATSRVKPGTSVLIAGWGAIKEGGNAVKNLRSTRVTVVSKRYCQKQYGSEARITRKMICAGGGGKDTCSGDSGGPMVFNNVLQGITSFGLGCARPKYPGVYVSVPNIRRWIAKVMANNS